VPEPSQIYVGRFRCATERSARGLVNSLLVVGLLPDLREPVVPEQPWEVAAEVELVPTEDNLSDLDDAMREVAQREGATFDGCHPED
jgi:hypothetical protein